MKKLLFLILLGVAGWYGWKHYPELLNRAPGHSAVVINQTDRQVTRLRLTVDGQTFVKEVLDPGATASFTFKVNNDSDIHLEWTWANKAGLKKWTGGNVPKGPLLARHEMTIVDDGEVNYRAMTKQ